MEQIIGISREQEAGATTTDVCRKHGISSARFTMEGQLWRAGSHRSLARRPNDENPRLTDAERPATFCYLAATLDIALAPALLAPTRPIKGLIADKAYDANSLRQLPRRSGRQGDDSFDRKPQPADPLQQDDLSPAQQDRAHVRATGGLPSHRHLL